MSQRGELLKGLSKRKISGDTRLLCSGAIKDLTDQQKEERAGQMVSVLNDSSDEQMFIDGLKEKGLI